MESVVLKIVVTYMMATGPPGAYIGFKMHTYENMEACESVRFMETEKVRAIFERNFASVQTINTTCMTKAMVQDQIGDPT